MVGVPVHVPLVAVRAWPSRAVPERAGSAVLAGAAGATSAVTADGVPAEPAAFVAVTTARIRLPTSAGVWV